MEDDVLDVIIRITEIDPVWAITGSLEDLIKGNPMDASVVDSDFNRLIAN